MIIGVYLNSLYILQAKLKFICQVQYRFETEFFVEKADLYIM